MAMRSVGMVDSFLEACCKPLWRLLPGRELQGDAQRRHGLQLLASVLQTSLPSPPKVLLVLT